MCFFFKSAAFTLKLMEIGNLWPKWFKSIAVWKKQLHCPCHWEFKNRVLKAFLYNETSYVINWNLNRNTISLLYSRKVKASFFLIHKDIKYLCRQNYFISTFNYHFCSMSQHQKYNSSFYHEKLIGCPIKLKCTGHLYLKIFVQWDPLTS